MSTQVITIQFSKQDVHNNNLSWYANTDVEISQGPTPHMKDYRPLMILKERERAFLRNKPPDGLLNPEQPALNTRTEQYH